MSAAARLVDDRDYTFAEAQEAVQVAQEKVAQAVALVAEEDRQQARIRDLEARPPLGAADALELECLRRIARRRVTTRSDSRAQLAVAQDELRAAENAAAAVQLAEAWAETAQASTRSQRGAP